MACSTAMGLCSRRVWAFASVAPGRELSLIGLIPPRSLEHENRPHTLHATCTADHCLQLTVNATKVKQLHICGDEDNCRQTEGLFPPQLLCEALEGREESDEGSFRRHGH